MSISAEEIDSILIRALSGTSTDTRFCFLHERVAEVLKSAKEHLSSHEIMQAVWSLVARRLAYIDYTQPHSENWSVRLTRKGWEAADDSTLNPDNIPLYLRRVSGDIPEMGEVAKFYLMEALQAYGADCYSASTMMLGVSAEAVFYETATSFACWLNSEAGKNLASTLAKPTVAYIQKFMEFQKRVSANKGHLPLALQQNLDLNINSTLELIRLVRNDVGHPTGTKIPRSDAFQYLVVFPGLARRLYDLKRHFDDSSCQ